MNIKSEILSMLKAVNGHLFSQQLCDKMGVSRTAVRKAMNELKEEGYKIRAIRNWRYHLVENADMITQAESRFIFHGRWIGGRLEYFDEADSTNTRARKLAEEGTIHGTLVVADSQWADKGRRGRLWTPPKGVDIWMSVVLRPTISPLHTSMLTSIAEMAVVKRVRSSTGLSAMIKWPNDAVLEGRKICGTLTEMNTEDECAWYVITEIGINVNIDESPGELAETAISLKLEKGENIRRSPVISAVMEAFEEYYDIFLETCDMSMLEEEYNRELANTNRGVMVLDPKGQYEETTLGIDNEKNLLVKKRDDTVASVIPREVSVRGIYGYVWSRTFL